MLTPENWKTPQNILVVLAHPDDPEFFCGATLARWAADGHHISYCLLTCGDKGVKDRHSAPADLCAIRQVEQRAAASILGVEKVEFLAYSDGYIVPDLKLRRDIVRAIRLARPEVVVTSDPTNLFVGDAYINHPDHRYAGQAVLDAVFPAAGNHLFFEELISDEASSRTAHARCG
jgi:LmbE family N-acetylglucosaminyl deacetylase